MKMSDQRKVCEFCDKPAIACGLRFAGDYTEATGPFCLCYECLSFQVECNGLPLDDPVIIDEKKYDKAVWK